MVAINTDSGNYFVGDSELDAYNEGIKKYPNKKLFSRELVLMQHLLLVHYNQRFLWNCFIIAGLLLREASMLLRSANQDN